MSSPRFTLLFSVAILLALQNFRPSHAQENADPICKNESLYTTRPDPIQYVVPGQNHCVECRHQSFNITDWILGDFRSPCNFDADMTCNIKINQNDSSMLCFEPVKLEDIDPVGFKCLFSGPGGILCSSFFNLTRGTVPTITDGSLLHTLDFDAGPLTLSPAFTPGVPPASLKWFHNGNPIPGAVSSTLTIGSGSNGNIDGSDRGLYEARAVGGVQEVSLTYTIIVRNFIPEVVLTTEPAVLTPGVTSQFKVICTVVSNPAIGTNGIEWSANPNVQFPSSIRPPNMIGQDYQVISEAEVMGCPNVVFTCTATSGQAVKSSFLNVCKSVPIATNLTAQLLAMDRVLLRWQNPSGDITACSVQYRQSGLEWQNVTCQPSSEQQEITDPGLSANTLHLYEFRVQITIGGTTTPSIILTLNEGKIPDVPPLGVHATRVSVGMVDVIIVRWQQIVSADFQISSYIITVENSLNDRQKTYQVDKTKQNFTVTDALKNLDYRIRVHAVNMFGHGPFSKEVVSINTDIGVVPLTVNLSAIVYRDNYVELSWRTGNINSIELVVDVLEIRSLERTNIPVFNINASTTSACLKMEPSTVYEFCVIVATEDGKSANDCERVFSETDKDIAIKDTARCTMLPQTQTGSEVLPAWVIAVIAVAVLIFVVVVFGGCGLYLGLKKNQKNYEMENPYASTEGVISGMNGYPQMRATSPPPAKGCMSYSRNNQHQMKWQEDQQQQFDFVNPTGFSNPGPVSVV